MSTLTAQDIYRQQTQRTHELFLYNPRNEPARGQFNGKDYVLPAADECWIKVKKGRVIEQHDEPGVLPIRGYVDFHKWDSRVIPAKVKNQEGIQQIVITPEMIVEHLVGPDRMSGQLGASGVRLLTGDPEKDEIIKKDARENWLRKQYEDALALRGAHEAMVAAATVMGKPISTPSPRVRAAYKTIAEYETGGGEFAVKYICPKCGERCKEDQDIRSHVAAYHRNDAASLLEKLKVPSLEARRSEEDEIPALEPVKRGPGRPRKVAE